MFFRRMSQSPKLISFLKINLYHVVSGSLSHLLSWHQIIWMYVKASTRFARNCQSHDVCAESDQTDRKDYLIELRNDMACDWLTQDHPFRCIFKFPDGTRTTISNMSNSIVSNALCATDVLFCFKHNSLSYTEL